MNFDKPFREKLQLHEEQPQNNIWAKLSMKLDEQEEEKKVIPILPTKHKAGWYIYRAAASVLFLVVVLSAWWAGRQGTESVERLAGRQGTKSVERLAGRQGTESVERLAGRQGSNHYEKITYQDTTSNKKYNPIKNQENKTQENKNNAPKTQENKNNTPKTQETKSKTFRPLLTRTELIATIKNYEIKIAEDLINQDLMTPPFEGAVVTAVFQSAKKSQKQRKNNFFSRNFLASKKREATPKRKIKILGFDVEKAFAKR